MTQQNDRNNQRQNVGQQSIGQQNPNRKPDDPNRKVQSPNEVGRQGQGQSQDRNKSQPDQGNRR